MDIHLMDAREFFTLFILILRMNFSNMEVEALEFVIY